MFSKFGFNVADKYRTLSEFSGGQLTKIAFIKLLLTRPDIMILDEPINHLDMQTIEWLEDYLKKYKKAVIVVSHDRMFLDKVCDVVYEIEYKTARRYPGNYSDFVARKQLDYEKQAKGYVAQQREIERLRTLVEHFKNTPAKVAMTRSKLMQIEHMVKIEAPKRYDTKSFNARFSPLHKGGNDVLYMNHLEIR
ncbi:MAG: ABC-F family ATP-binding cassette domain-containing protein [Niameybacter sp.]|nr:ABC-F family ATP-binding cassette domain-containing protein [Niameybacter sp.]